VFLSVGRYLSVGPFFLSLKLYMPDFPRLVAANAAGEIFDVPEVRAAGRSGREIYQLDPSILIPLPENSRLYFLPKRTPWLRPKAE
jgi:hypothetical protein